MASMLQQSQKAIKCCCNWRVICKFNVYNAELVWERECVSEFLTILIFSFFFFFGREFSVFDNECMVRGSGFHWSSSAAPPDHFGLGTCLTLNLTVVWVRNSSCRWCPLNSALDSRSFCFFFFFLSEKYLALIVIICSALMVCYWQCGLCVVANKKNSLLVFNRVTKYHAIWEGVISRKIVPTPAPVILSWWSSVNQCGQR